MEETMLTKTCLIFQENSTEKDPNTDNVRKRILDTSNIQDDSAAKRLTSELY